MLAGRFAGAHVIELPIASDVHGHVDIAKEILSVKRGNKLDIFAVGDQGRAHFQTHRICHRREERVQFVGVSNAALEDFGRCAITILGHLFEDLRRAPRL